MTQTEQNKNNDFGLFFWVHLAIIILIYLLPFLFDWKIVLGILILYLLQIKIFGSCVLTIAQFKDKTRRSGFYYYYLTKLGFKLNQKRVNFTVTYIIPTVIFITALVWQILLSKVPLFF